MRTIALEGLEFFSYHGVHIEEHVIGNRYSIDIEVGFDFDKAANSDKLKDTLDYGELYKIIEEVMQKPHYLLEHITEQIMENTHKNFPSIYSIKVSVAKHNPPLGGLCKWAKVTNSRTY